MKTYDFSNADILFTDFDDTLTTDGRLLPETYSAICKLAESGVSIIPVTGGCAGWCDQIIRTWPVRAVIGEGGAFFIERKSSQVTRWEFWENREQHSADQATILAYVSKLDLGFQPQLATDQPFRYVDVAIDYNQQETLLEHQVATLTEALSAEGFNVRQSSIHLNVWLGDFDKCTMAIRVGKTLLGLDPDELKARSVFIGDAPNDESMFEFFPLSFGVANINEHLEKMQYKPAFNLEQHSGLGFVEMANMWLRERAPSPQAPNSSRARPRPLANA